MRVTNNIYGSVCGILDGGGGGGETNKMND